MQKQEEAEVRNGSVEKLPPNTEPQTMDERRAGLRILRHLFPHKVQRLLVEHDEMRSEIQRLQVQQESLDETNCELQRLRVQCETIARIRSDSTERTLLLQGQLATHTISKTATLGNLADTEFRVFSQWGEDGIVEWLVSHVAVPNHRFVEFGVGNFIEVELPIPDAKPQLEGPHFRWQRRIYERVARRSHVLDV